MKKSLSILLAIALVFSMFSSLAFADEHELTAQEKYDALKEKGIFKGINDAGDAGLDQPMNRAQFARVAALILGLEGIGDIDTKEVTEKPFDDVELGEWYTEEVAAVKEAGIFVGNGDGTFTPVNNISVQELAAVVVTLLGLTPVEDAEVDGADSWAAKYIQAILDAGIEFPTNYTEPAVRSDLASLAYTADMVINPPVEEEVMDKVTTVSAVTATTVKFVLETAPAADLVAADISKFEVLVNGTAVTPTAITKDVADTTGKTYTLTIPTLANTQGTLTVNGTAPVNVNGGTVLNSEYNFDFAAPTVVSVSAINKNTIIVTFSEKLDLTTAQTLANYAVTKITPFTALTENTVTLDSTRKVATLTVTESMIDSINGYNIAFTGDAIKDLAGNKVVAAERIFSGNGANDTLAPVIVTASYDKSTGKLILDLNKKVKTTDALLDETKITISGSSVFTLVEADYTATAASADSTTVTITLSDASKTSVNALGDTLTLGVAADAISDTNATAVKNTEITGVPVTLTTAPTLSTVSYASESRLLTLTFTGSAIDVSEIDKTAISVGGVALGSTSTVTTTTDSLVVVIELAPSISVNAATTVSLTAAAAKNAAGTAMVAISGKAITFTADSTGPVINSAVYNDATNELTLNFNEVVDVSATAIGSIGWTDGTASDTFAATTAVVGTTDSKTVRIALQAGTDATALEAGSVIRGSLKFVLGASAFVDMSGNGSLAVAAADNKTFTYTDMSAPTLPNPTQLTSTTISITYSEKVTNANVASNYTIKSGLLTVPVTAVSALADGRTFILTTGAQSAVAYTLSVANVTDAAGNPYVDPASLPTWTGDATLADVTAPTVTSAVFTDNGDSTVSAGDKITVTFSEPLAAAIANVTSADFTFGAGITIGNATFAYGPTNETIVITFGTTTTTTWATPANVTVAAAAGDLDDAAGNNTTAVAAVVASPGGAVTITKVTYIDSNVSYTKNAGDTVEIKFNQAITLDGTPTAADFLAPAELLLIGTAGGTTAAIKSGTTDTVVVTTTGVATIAFDIADGFVGIAGTPTNAWGVAQTVNGTPFAGTKGDATNAKPISAVYDKSANTLTVTMDKVMTVSAVDFASRLVARVGGITLTWTGAVTPVAGNTNIAVFTLADAADQAAFESGSLVEFQVAIVGTTTAMATDAYGNVLAPANAFLTVTVQD